MGRRVREKRPVPDRLPAGLYPGVRAQPRGEAHRHDDPGPHVQGLGGRMRRARQPVHDQGLRAMDVVAVLEGRFVPPAPPTPVAPPNPPAVNPALTVVDTPGTCPECFTTVVSGTGFHPNSEISITFVFSSPTTPDETLPERRDERRIWIVDTGLHRAVHIRRGLRGPGRGRRDCNGCGGSVRDGPLERCVSRSAGTPGVVWIAVEGVNGIRSGGHVGRPLDRLGRAEPGGTVRGRAIGTHTAALAQSCSGRRRSVGGVSRCGGRARHACAPGQRDRRPRVGEAVRR